MHEHSACSQNFTVDLCRDMVDAGEVVNHEASAHTLLQGFESSTQVEVGWSVTEVEIGWTKGRIGQSKMEPNTSPFAMPIRRYRLRSAVHCEKTVGVFDGARF